MTRIPVRLLLSALLLGPAAGALAAEKKPQPPPPAVDWRSFDAATLEKARAEGKLIFLSILSPWGHWDRIMREVTFADPRIVSVLNERYLPVLVDALERPDLFTRYGMGGWPTTTFVLPTGQPLYYADPNGAIVRAGGAFYSAEALVPFLEQMADYFAKARETSEAAAEEIARNVIARKEVGKAPLTTELIEATVTLTLEAHRTDFPDPRVRRPMHPDPDSAELAFAYFIRKGNRDVLDTALRMLAEMARGGIHDQIGGGFHRFAADAAWRVPAFEKLLSANAELLQVYADAHRLAQHTRYREIAEGIADWAVRDMRDPAGWFRPYQAADAKLGDDGDYYTWTLEEFRAAIASLPKEQAEWLVQGYEVGEWGEMVESAPRRNVLHLSEGPFLLSRRLEQKEETIEAAFQAGRKALLAARSRRPAPPAGNLLIVDANAAMAGALIHAGAAWGRADLIQAGIEALDFAWEKARDGKSGLFPHVWTAAGGRGAPAPLFADQVHMTRALLEAWECTGEARHRDRARDLARAAREAFADSLDGGWNDRLYEESAPGLLSWPTRQIRDNALFADALLRLRWILGEKPDEEHGKASRKALESWADDFGRYEEGAAPFGLAVLRTLSSPLEIEIGPTAGSEGAAVRSAALALYHPWRIVRFLPDGEAQPAPGVRFCIEGRCSEHWSSAEGLRAKLWQFLTPPSQPEAKP